ncbi:two pore calcium channel protein 1-like [Arctopsyche grandis]|uniref:two pore calcium channel protein 1-like n=1 Tax=Arctopsyche grandis TaxID=121162 RepID=UPI00406D9A3D
MAALRGTAFTPDDGYTRFADESYGAAGLGCDVTRTNANGDGIMDNVRSAVLDLGSRSSLNRSNHEHLTEEDHWEMNYHEAAIYLEEGLNNEKFDSHPSSPGELPAYLRVHNPWYHGLDLSASLLLMLLAFTEDPAVPLFELPVGIHGTVELLALSVIGVELFLKLKWIGWRTILKHKRTMLKCVTLFIMVLEAFVVLLRQCSHFRVTRALRPIFLVDTRHCGGVRRFIRQILQSLPPILDMLGLLLFFVTTYSLLGFYLFSEHIDTQHFNTISDSFVSMFVLLTTANFPDVMMPSYAKSKWYAIFFISYIATVLYVLMNLMLAVVYETFTRIEREKYRRLLLHRRRACQHAFRLLVSKQTPGAVRFRQFHGLMRYFTPHKSTRDVLLMFKQLNGTASGALTLEEFLSVYECGALRWAPQHDRAPWYGALGPIEVLGRAAFNIVNWPYFEHIVFTLIIGNGVSMLIRITEASGGLQDSARLFCASWDTWLFLILFLIEAGLRMMAQGMRVYLSSGWNMFDLIATVLGICGAILLVLAPNFIIVVIFRPLRLMRLYKLKKRYRDVFGTLVLLSPLMSSAACVMLVMYYFFAIVGMELFSSYDMRNCCVNTTVEDFYKYSANSSTALGFYYLNTFENLLTSGVTLFELTVVNNWFIIMNAYAFVANQWSRIYFMVFYLFTMVVLTIVVASVLEAFRFRIHYKRSTTKRDEEKLLHEEVHVSWEEVQRLGIDGSMADQLRPHLPAGSVVTFIGSRPRTREVLQRRMYTNEIQRWLSEAAREERDSTNVLSDVPEVNETNSGERQLI